MGASFPAAGRSFENIRGWKYDGKFLNFVNNNIF